MVGINNFEAQVVYAFENLSKVLKAGNSAL
ncbi:hypothetical protein, partial [Photobacterium sp. OFAV2-7]